MATTKRSLLVATACAMLLGSAGLFLFGRTAHAQQVPQLVLVRDVDTAALDPFWAQRFFDRPYHCGGIITGVPTGKRLVIEFVASRAQGVHPAWSAPSLSIHTAKSGDRFYDLGVLNGAPLTPNGPNGLDFRGSFPVRIYAFPGDVVSYFDLGRDIHHCFASLSGHYVDVSHQVVDVP